MSSYIDDQIKMYAKHLRVPTFTAYNKTLRQVDQSDADFATLLLALMKAEYEQRQENNNRRRLKQACFPYTKSLDELDLSRYSGKISELFINGLSICRFIDEKKNLIMVGNPGRGKT